MLDQNSASEELLELAHQTCLGGTKESDGASMWCTKDVLNSLSSTSFVMCSNCAPSVSAEISSGAMALSSGLVMMLPTRFKASRAASFTST